MRATPKQKFDALLKLYSLKMPMAEAKTRALTESGLSDLDEDDGDSGFSEVSEVSETVVGRNVELRRQLTHAERRAAAAVARAEVYRRKFNAAIDVIVELTEILDDKAN